MNRGKDAVEDAVILGILFATETGETHSL
jgi:hypothetical protein